MIALLASPLLIGGLIIGLLFGIVLERAKFSTVARRKQTRVAHWPELPHEARACLI